MRHNEQDAAKRTDQIYQYLNDSTGTVKPPAPTELGNKLISLITGKPYHAEDTEQSTPPVSEPTVR